jgi:hypothetical protein
MWRKLLGKEEKDTTRKITETHVRPISLEKDYEKDVITDAEHGISITRYRTYPMWQTAPYGIREIPVYDIFSIPTRPRPAWHCVSNGV